MIEITILVLCVLNFAFFLGRNYKYKALLKRIVRLECMGIQVEIRDRKEIEDRIKTLECEHEWQADDVVRHMNTGEWVLRWKCCHCGKMTNDAWDEVDKEQKDAVHSLFPKCKMDQLRGDKE